MCLKDFLSNMACMLTEGLGHAFPGIFEILTEKLNLVVSQPLKRTINIGYNKFSLIVKYM